MNTSSNRPSTSFLLRRASSDAVLAIAAPNEKELKRTTKAERLILCIEELLCYREQRNSTRAYRVPKTLFPIQAGIQIHIIVEIKLGWPPARGRQRLDVLDW